MLDRFFSVTLRLEERVPGEVVVEERVPLSERIERAADPVLWAPAISEAAARRASSRVGSASAAEPAWLTHSVAKGGLSSGSSLLEKVIRSRIQSSHCLAAARFPCSAKSSACAA